jgi:uncharacterized protein (DUF58 family)
VEARLAQLCRWVLEAERRGMLYGLSLPDAELPPGIGPRHRATCLAALADFGPSRAPGIDAGRAP